jgi:flagellar biosynthesis/type III secretory pathway M-ring protein FliF/YscJ
MSSVTRQIDHIRRQLGQLTSAHKLLIGCVVVILAMTLFLVGQYTGKPALVEVLPGAPANDQEHAAAFLSDIGIIVDSRGGKMLVAASDANRARSRLAEAGKLPNDKALLFENILRNPSWTNSRQQNEQLYNSALQNELAMRIAEFKGIKTAKVFIDTPEPLGLGGAVRKPSASATVTTGDGRTLPQATVDAIAHFIAGSKSGLTIDRVRVIDASSGRQRKATNEDEILPTTYLEHATRVEAQTREKVLELLSYIPGVVVAVTAHVDVSRSTAQVRTHMPEKQGTVTLRKRETENTQSLSESSRAAEPGFGANQTADINFAGGAGTRSETSEVSTDFENHIGSKTETIVDPRGHATMVAVSVNIPKGFVAELARRDGAPDAQPGEQEITNKFADIRRDVVESLAPHVRAMIAQANSSLTVEDARRMIQEAISVSMIPVDVVMSGATPQQAGMMGGLASLTSDGTVGGMVETGMLVLLAAVSLGMMLMMVKRAGRRDNMPSAEELVGLPPSLETDSDVVGEADEGETAMAGIEVNEDQAQAQKMLQQLGDMVSQKPDLAAKLVNRWINVEE